MMVKRPVLTVLLVGLLLVGSSPISFGWPLSLQQRARLRQYLPNTFIKLENRDPVRVVALGDGNIYGLSKDDEERLSGDALSSFSGIFLREIADLFFYTGGVRLLNPPEGGRQKLDEFKGPEIQLENLGLPEASILSGLQRIKSDAFLNDPDLVLIQYGASDAQNQLSIYHYRRSLYHIIEECKKRNVDVIIFGPTPVNRGGGAMEWGITRPYATAAQGMAKSQGVLFIDSGKILIKVGGAADHLSTPMSGTAVIGDRLKRLFYIAGSGKQQDISCLNQRSHQRLGEVAFHELLDGTEKSDFLAAGSSIFGEKGMARVVVSIRNQTGEPKSGLVGALKVGGLEPVDPSQRYTIEPGMSEELTFDYKRPVVGRSQNGSDIYYPLEIDDELVRFPFVIEDGIKTEFLDLPLRVAPLTISWKSQQYIDVANQMKVEWEFVSGSQKNVSGSYRIGMGNGVSQSQPFSVGPLGRKKATANLRFTPPSNTSCFQSDLFLEVVIDGKTYRFTREVEASRDLVLGEKTLMVPGETYGSAPAGSHLGTGAKWAPTMYFDAATDGGNAGLYAVVDLKGIEVPNLGKNSASLRVVISVDGRPRGRARDFGAVSPVVIFFAGGGGKGYIPDLPLGAFGDGYAAKLDRGGIKSVYRNGQIQIRIPKEYLGELDWNLEGDTMVGIRLVVSVIDPDNSVNQFPLNRTFATNFPELIYENETIRGMTAEDAQGLTTLRFTREPQDRWSVRVY